MSKFNFRLRTLLRLRESARDDCRAKLGEAIQAEQVLQRQMSQVAFELTTVREKVRTSTQVGEVNVDQLLSTHRYELLLRAQHQQFMEQARQVAEEIERRRVILVEADKQVRILEKLRENQRSEFDFAEEKLRVKELDEIASQRYARSSREESKD